MALTEEELARQKIHKLLLQLCITPIYKGFEMVSYAIWLCAQQPELLGQVTVALYPMVAKHFQTSWKCVDRNIRTVVTVAWKYNPELLSELAGIPLKNRPRNAQFLAIVSTRLFGTNFRNNF